jgi:tetratricopeptide (TPR) repeat protein
MPTAIPSSSDSPVTPDPVLETQLFWERNKWGIVGAIALVILALCGYAAYHYKIAQRDAAAAEILAEAKVPADYEKVIAQYPSAPAGGSAYLLLAAEQRKAQKFDEANATLAKFVAQFPKHELITTAKMAMAANLDSLGKADDALEAYRRVAADYPRDFNAPLALLSQAQALRRKGQNDEARRVCETILTQYRESFASAEASNLLRQLKPSAPAEAAPPVPAAAASAAPALPPAGASVPAVAASPAASTERVAADLART